MVSFFTVRTARERRPCASLPASRVSSPGPAPHFTHVNIQVNDVSSSTVMAVRLASARRSCTCCHTGSSVQMGVLYTIPDASFSRIGRHRVSRRASTLHWRHTVAQMAKVRASMKAKHRCKMKAGGGAFMDDFLRLPQGLISLAQSYETNHIVHYGADYCLARCVHHLSTPGSHRGKIIDVAMTDSILSGPRGSPPNRFMRQGSQGAPVGSPRENTKS